MKCIEKVTSQSALIVLLALAAGSANAVDLTAAAVGVYDENAFATNVVDTIADGTANGTAVGASATDVLDVFSAAIPTAFAAGFGGVATFDGNGNVAPDTTVVDAIRNINTLNSTFAGGTKTLPITFRNFANTQDLANISGGNSNFVQYGSANSVSGLGASTSFGSQKAFQPANDGADTVNISGDWRFNFGAIIGGVPGEILTQVGITMLSRTGTFDTTTSTVTAFFSGGGSSSLSSNFTTVAGNDDTFFYFAAPAGESITALGFNTPNNRLRPVDDLGFITSAPASVVPEAGTLPMILSVGLSAAGAVIIRRRK